MVDLTSNIAAPFGSAILADLGAQVVHIEPSTGDDSRHMSPTDADASAYFYVVNRNKRFTTLDLRVNSDRDSLHELLTGADVFVTNLRLRNLMELGLDQQALAESFPELISAYLNAYGPHPTVVNDPGYDGVVQARTGITAVTGGAEPARAGVSVLDMGSGMWLAIGVLAALYQRSMTGVGSTVSTSLFETGVAWGSYHLLAHQLTGEPSTRSGAGHPAFAPYGLFRTRDGSIMIGVGGEAVFARLAETLGQGELLLDSRFATNTSRIAHSIELTAIIELALSHYTREEAVLLLRTADVPADVLALPEDLLEDVAAAQQLASVDLKGRSFYVPALPLRINGEYPPVTFPS